MSHSQFHSTKLLILRHSWLNLCDKHMTTGRINQVTITARTPFFLSNEREKHHVPLPFHLLALCALRLPVRVSFHRLKHFFQKCVQAASLLSGRPQIFSIQV